jgi:hypothetical protein
MMTTHQALMHHPHDSGKLTLATPAGEREAETPAIKEKGGKDPNWNEAHSIIPPFGDATARKLAIKLYTIDDFYQHDRECHYQVHRQRVYEKNTLPGYITTSPSDTFVQQRLLSTQSYDQTVHLQYHKALGALYQASHSIDHYYVVEEASKFAHRESSRNAHESMAHRSNKF